MREIKIDREKREKGGCFGDCERQKINSAEILRYDPLNLHLYIPIYRLSSSIFSCIGWVSKKTWSNNTPKYFNYRYLNNCLILSPFQFIQIYRENTFLFGPDNLYTVTKKIYPSELPCLRKIVGMPVRMHRVHGSTRANLTARIDAPIIIYMYECSHNTHTYTHKTCRNL